MDASQVRVLEYQEWCGHKCEDKEDALPHGRWIQASRKEGGLGEKEGHQARSILLLR